MKPPVPADWIDAYFEDYDRITSRDRARRMEPLDGRLTDWLMPRIAPTATSAEIASALDVIERLVTRASGDAKLLAYVGAGPLEDLLRRHAESVSDRLVQRTKSDPDFREAMKNVWGWEDVPNVVQERLLPLLEDAR